jgi:hypothetical protein
MGARGREIIRDKPLDCPVAPKLRECDPDNASNDNLLALEASYCSHGDTVHYTNVPKIFDRCNGSFLYGF